MNHCTASALNLQICPSNATVSDRAPAEVIRPASLWLGLQATNEELNIAKAAAGGNLFAAKVAEASELKDVLKKTIDSVTKSTRAVINGPGSSRQKVIVLFI